jgi:ABC-type nitrate/sulfonate/bicarbonate transport system ATPase subunit
LEVFEGKRSIETKSALLCKDANAILIIGKTGAGKSTLLTALAGYKLIFVK